MNHPQEVNDEALARLQALTARLTEHIGEARDVLARLVHALETDAWPRLRSVRLHPQPYDRRSDYRFSARFTERRLIGRA